MRKSDFDFKFYTVIVILSFKFYFLGFNDEIFFSREAHFIHFKMTYCRCYSCKYLLRYELKTECGQFLHFLAVVFKG